jgi:hypothetical protein
MIEYITEQKFKDSKEQFYILYGYPNGNAITRTLNDNFPTFIEPNKDYIIKNIHPVLPDVKLNKVYVVKFLLELKDIDFKKLGIIFMLMKEQKFTPAKKILECTEKSLDHLVNKVIPTLYQDKDFEVNKDTTFAIKLIGHSSLVDPEESLSLFEKYLNQVENKIKVYVV